MFFESLASPKKVHRRKALVRGRLRGLYPWRGRREPLILIMIKFLSNPSANLDKAEFSRQFLFTKVDKGEVI